MAQQHRLIAQGDTSIGQSPQRLADFGGQFSGMVGVDADKERVELPEHGTQCRCDPLRQKNGNTGADPQEFDVGNSPQAAQQIL